MHFVFSNIFLSVLWKPHALIENQTVTTLGPTEPIKSTINSPLFDGKCACGQGQTTGLRWIAALSHF